MVRFKNRYIVVQVTPDIDDKSFQLKTNALQQSILQKIKQLYGEYMEAAVKSGFNAKYCNSETRIALIKVRHGPDKQLTSAVPQIGSIGGKSVTVKILYIGATMKHCFLFIRKHQRRKLEESWQSLRNKVEQDKLQNSLLTLTPAMKDFN